MTAEVTGFNMGVISLKLIGTLTEAALQSAERKIADMIRAQGSVRILIDAIEFNGWDLEGSWDDLSFEIENDAYIEKMAFIGDREWQDMILVFVGKRFRRFSIRYFDPTEYERARDWVSS